MAKTRKKQSSLPTTDDGAPQATPGVEVEIRSLEIPVINLVVGYVTNRCDVASMTERQRMNLRKIQNGLIADGATLENGKEVRTGADAFRWILEAVQ